MSTAKRLETELRGDVEAFAHPRHRWREPARNRATAALLAQRFRALGLEVRRHGTHDNIVATTPGIPQPRCLIGAHYDSVPGTPGADDNASGLAVMLAAARLLDVARDRDASVGFVAFNCEEDGLLGSAEFARALPWRPRIAHVLEMVGFTRPGAEFLLLLANPGSEAALETVRAAVRRLGPDAPPPDFLMTLSTEGAERWTPDFQRSDHYPLWEAGVPALLWTDTANFRNPHYHQPSDTPDTLDYRFMANVTRALVASSRAA